MGNILSLNEPSGLSRDQELLNGSGQGFSYLFDQQICKSKLFERITENYMNEIESLLGSFVKLEEEENGNLNPFKKVSNIFRNQNAEHHLLKVSDYSILTNDNMNISCYAEENKTRVYCLVRVFAAFYSVLSQNIVSIDDSNVTFLNIKSNSTMNEFSTETEFSMSMCLALAKTVGQDNPAIFNEMINAITVFIKKHSEETASAPNAVINKFPCFGSKKLRSLYELAQDFVTSYCADATTTPEQRSNRNECARAALGLMVVIAITTGCLRSMLEIAHLVEQKDLPLPPSAAAVLMSWNERALGTSQCPPNRLRDSTVVAHFVSEMGKRAPSNISACALATDGSYLYIWDGGASSLTKLGSGLFHTHPGQVIARNGDVQQQLTKAKLNLWDCSDAAIQVMGTFTSLALVKNKVYLFSATNGILVFKKSSLAFVEMIKLSSLAKPERQIPGTEAPLVAIGGTRSVECSEKDTMDIHALPGSCISRVLKAEFNGVDVTSDASKFIVDDGMRFFVHDLVSFAPPVDESESNRWFRAVIEISPSRSNDKVLSDESFPMTSDGKSLVVLSKSLDMADALLEAVAPKSDVIITSAYFCKKNYYAGDVTSKVKALWAEFLDSPTNTAPSAIVGNELLGIKDRAGDAEESTGEDDCKLLYINFALSRNLGEGFTVSFPEDSNLNFDVLLQRVLMLISGRKFVFTATVCDPITNNAYECTLSDPSMHLSANFANVALRFNGRFLVVQLKIGENGHSCRAIFESSSHDLQKNGALIESFTAAFVTKHGPPRVLAFDPRNNFTWSLDPISSVVKRWRNRGLVSTRSIIANPAPLQLSSANPTVEIDCTDIHACVNLALQLEKNIDPKCAARSHAVMIRSMLAQVSSEIYESNNVLTRASEHEANHLISIKVRGRVKDLCEYGSHSISICGQLITHSKPDNKNHRGYNVVTLDSQSLLSEGPIPFDYQVFTCGENSQGESLAAYLELVEDGHIVIIATKGSATVNFSTRACDALRSIGVAAPGRLYPTVTWPSGSCSFAVIGIKGAEPGTVAQIICDGGEICSLEQHTPTNAIPLCVQPEASTLHTIIGQCSAAVDSLSRSDSYPYIREIGLISLLRILTVNVSRLVQGTRRSDILKLISADDRAILSAFLDRLLQQKSLKTKLSKAVSSCALNAFAACLPVTHATEDDTKNLLSSLIKNYEEQTLTDEQRWVFGIVVEKFSDMASVSRMLKPDDLREAENLCDALSSFIEKDLTQKFEAVVESVENDDDTCSEMGASASKLFYPLMLGLLTKVTSRILQASSTDLVAQNADALLRMVNKVVGMCERLLMTVIDCNGRLQDPSVLNLELDRLMKSSPLKIILPSILLSLGSLLALRGHAISPHVEDTIVGFVHELLDIQGYVHQLIEIIPHDRLRVMIKQHSIESSVVSRVYEGPHPYYPNMNVREDFYFPLAQKIVITFDPETQTESSRDYLTFFDDQGEILSLRLSGNSNTWPGVGSNRPLELPVGTTKFYTIFISDGSCEYWGYRMTVSVTQLSEIEDDQEPTNVLATTPLTPSSTVILTNAHEHPLVKTLECFGCAKEVHCVGPTAWDAINAYSWSCIECDYSLCLACVCQELNSTLPDTASLPNIHPHTLTKLMRPSGVMCNLMQPNSDQCACRSGADRLLEDNLAMGQQHMWTCADCDFDCCIHCFVAEVDAANPPPSSSKPPPVVGTFQPHWILQLEEQMVDVTCTVSSMLIEGEPLIKNLETAQNTSIMEDVVITSQISLPSRVPYESDEERLLYDLIERPKGSLAEKLVDTMREKVREDQGHIEVIDATVYATCAALIKHNHLGAEAVAIAKGVRVAGADGRKISAGFLKAWRTAQKMRIYMNLGELSPNTASGAASPRVLSASMEQIRVMEVMTQNIVEKVKFLLRSPSGVEYKDQASIPSQDSPTHSINHGASRWNLLKRAALSQKNKKSFQDIAVGATAIETFKKITQWRIRLASDKIDGTKSVTQRILTFLQSTNIEISQLQALQQLRNVRAESRLKGFELSSRILETASSSGFSTFWCTAKIRQALWKCCADGDSVHYLNFLQGASPDLINSIMRAFSKILSRCVKNASRLYPMVMDLACGKEKRETARISIISCLQACAMDYTVPDLEALNDSKIINLLGNTLSSSDSKIAALSESLLEVFVSNSHEHGKLSKAQVTLDPLLLSGDDSEYLDATLQFSQSIANLMVKSLGKVGDAIGAISKPAQQLTNLTDISRRSSVKLIDGTMALYRDVPGIVVAPTIVTKQSKITCSIIRASVFEFDAVSDNLIVKGSVVMRSRQWASRKNEDGGIGGLGIVESIFLQSGGGKNVVVRWGNRKDLHDCRMHELTLAHPDVGGHIFSKGCPAIEVSGVTAWSTFGLTLLHDATLSFFVSSNDLEESLQDTPELIHVRGKKRVEPNVWTQIRIELRETSVSMFVDGDLDAEMSFPLSLSSQKCIKCLESNHPYNDNENIYTPFAFSSGVESLTVTFDERTATESGCDYVTFYKDETHSAFWGDRQYSGRGRGENRFPGLCGIPPLVIPSNKFELFFHSDGSQNDWGYKMKVEGTLRRSAQIGQSINEGQFFIGQLPFHAIRQNILSVKSSFEGIIANLAVETAAEGIEASASDPSRYFSASRFSNGVQDAPSPFNSQPEEPTMNDDVVQILPPMVEIGHNYILSILGITSVGVEALHARGDQALSTTGYHIGSQISSSDVISSLLPIAAGNTSIVLKHAAIKILAGIAPFLPPAAVENQAIKVGLVSPGSEGGLIAALFRDIRQIGSGEANYGFAIGGKMNLLRALALSSYRSTGMHAVEWSVAMAAFVKKEIAIVCELLASIKDANCVFAESQIAQISSLLAFLGGDFHCFYTGSRAIARTSDAVAEGCLILGPAHVPILNESTEKKDSGMWAGLEGFGEAVLVSLDSQPGKAVLVPRRNLQFSDDAADSELFSQFLCDHIGSSVLCDMFAGVLAIDIRDTRSYAEPFEEEGEIVRVFESSHPYSDNIDYYETVDLGAGCKSIEIEFDKNCATEANCDYLVFYKDESRSNQWGLDKYTGPKSNEAWSKLIIPASSFVLHFHSDGSNNDWGYKFTVRGEGKTVIPPPPREPSLRMGIVTQSIVKMLGMKTISMLLKRCREWLLEPVITSSHGLSSLLVSSIMTAGDVNPLLREFGDKVDKLLVWSTVARGPVTTQDPSFLSKLSKVNMHSCFMALTLMKEGAANRGSAVKPTKRTMRVRGATGSLAEQINGYYTLCDPPDETNPFGVFVSNINPKRFLEFIGSAKKWFINSAETRRSDKGSACCKMPPDLPPSSQPPLPLTPAFGWQIKDGDRWIDAPRIVVELVVFPLKLYKEPDVLVDEVLASQAEYTGELSSHSDYPRGYVVKPDTAVELSSDDGSVLKSIPGGSQLLVLRETDGGERAYVQTVTGEVLSGWINVSRENYTLIAMDDTVAGAVPWARLTVPPSSREQGPALEAGKSSAYPAAMTIGDIVVRGKDWNCDSQDVHNGALTQGRVIGTIDSFGLIKVEWLTADATTVHWTGNYRYNSSFRDVQLAKVAASPKGRLVGPSFKHPMMFVASDSASSSSLSSTDSESMRAQLDQVEVSVALFSQTAVEALTLECVVDLVKHWPADLNCSPSNFGEISLILQLMERLLLEPGSFGMHGMMARMMKLIRESLLQNPALLKVILQLCERELTTSDSNDSAISPPKTLARSIESAHPCILDADFTHSVRIPGATRLIVYADARSSIAGAQCEIFSLGTPEEKNAVRSASLPFQESPVVLEGDNCRIRIQAPENAQVDWGYHFAVYGVMDEGEKPAEGKKKRKIKPQLRKPHHRELAIWLLTCFFKETDDSTICSSLYRVEVFSYVIAYFESNITSPSEGLLELVTTVAVNLPMVPLTLVTADLMKCLERLRNKTAEEVSCEEAAKSITSDVTLETQTLIQITVLLDATIETLKAKMIEANGLPADATRAALVASDVVWSGTVDQKPGKSLTRRPGTSIISVALRGYFNERTSWNIRIDSCSLTKTDAIIIGIACLPLAAAAPLGTSGVSVGFSSSGCLFVCSQVEEALVAADSPPPAVLLNSSSDMDNSDVTPPSPPSPLSMECAVPTASSISKILRSECISIPQTQTFSAGDIITVKLDLCNGSQSVSFYLNGTLVVSRDLPSPGCWYPAVSLCNEGDSVSIVDYDLLLPRNATAIVPANHTGADTHLSSRWLDSVKRAFVVMHPSHSGHVPLSILHRFFLPKCSAMACMTVRASDLSPIEEGNTSNAVGADSKIYRKTITFDGAAAVLVILRVVCAEIGSLRVVALDGSISDSPTAQQSDPAPESAWLISSTESSMKDTQRQQCIGKFLRPNITGDCHAVASTALSLPWYADEAMIGSRIVVGSKLAIEYSTASESEGFVIELIPRYSLSAARALPTFQPLLQTIMLEIVGKPSTDLALAQYVNNYARSHQMSLEKLLVSEWKDIAPTKDALVAMSTLSTLVHTHPPVRGYFKSRSINKCIAQPPVGPGRVRVIQAWMQSSRGNLSLAHAVDSESALPVTSSVQLSRTNSNVVRTIPLDAIIEIDKNTTTMVQSSDEDDVERVQLFDRSGWVTWRVLAKTGSSVIECLEEIDVRDTGHDDSLEDFVLYAELYDQENSGLPDTSAEIRQTENEQVTTAKVASHISMNVRDGITVTSNVLCVLPPNYVVRYLTNSVIETPGDDGDLLLRVQLTDLSGWISKGTRHSSGEIEDYLVESECVVNCDGVSSVLIEEGGHDSSTPRHYCGRNVGQRGYASPCGSCDGYCGPRSGCQCNACFVIDESGGDADVARALFESLLDAHRPEVEGDEEGHPDSSSVKECENKESDAGSENDDVSQQDEEDEKGSHEADSDERDGGEHDVSSANRSSAGDGVDVHSPLHHHPLRRRIATLEGSDPLIESYFFCDGRQQPGGCRSGDEHSRLLLGNYCWCCSECSYTMCIACMMESVSVSIPETFTSIHHPHPLTRKVCTYSGDMFQCDRGLFNECTCGRPDAHPQYGYAWHCVECQFDLCYPCSFADNSHGLFSAHASTLGFIDAGIASGNEPASFSVIDAVLPNQFDPRGKDVGITMSEDLCHVEMVDGKLPNGLSYPSPQTALSNIGITVDGKYSSLTWVVRGYGRNTNWLIGVVPSAIFESDLVMDTRWMFKSSNEHVCIGTASLSRDSNNDAIQLHSVHDQELEVTIACIANKSISLRISKRNTEEVLLYTEDIASMYPSSSEFRLGCAGFQGTKFEMLSCAAKVKAVHGSKRMAKSRTSHSLVESRFQALQEFNKALERALPCFNLLKCGPVNSFGGRSVVVASHESRTFSLPKLLSATRGMIFDGIRTPYWEAAIANTKSSSARFELNLSRGRAAAHAHIADKHARYAVFSQAFRKLHPMHPSELCTGEQLYKVNFQGEQATDAGGPYRESFEAYAAELESPALSLLVRCPNATELNGMNRNCWIFNPQATSATEMEMFKFLGKLMGIAIRSKQYLRLNFSSFIWKLICGDEPTIDDLKSIDLSKIQNTLLIKSPETTEEAFDLCFGDQTFTTFSAAGAEVELVPGGTTIPLTYANRLEYVEAVLHYKLHEFDAQVAAVREGLSTIVPLSLLNLFTWSSVEFMVCGNPEVDLVLLKKCTEYRNCSTSDPHVQFFWQAMEEFSEEDRSAFLRFVWGRSRLPLREQDFLQKFRIEPFAAGRAVDSYLPISHTCYFSIELPTYSSLDVMKEKLRYAIHNCQDIDGDGGGTGPAVAAMGWESD